MMRASVLQTDSIPPVAGDERSEASVLEACRKVLRKRGAWFQKTQQGGKSGGRRGIPDLIICYRGHFLGVELKAPSKRAKVSVQQQLEIEAIRRAGGVAAVANHEDQLTALLDSIDELED